VHSVGGTLRLSTRPRDRVQNGETPRYKSWAISFARFSTIFAEAHQLRKAVQADDGKEASQPSSPTATSVSQSCVACSGLIPRDWPRRFQYCRLGWLAMEEAASTWGKTKWACAVAGHRWNLVRGDDFKVRPTKWSGPKIGPATRATGALRTPEQRLPSGAPNEEFG